MDITRHRVARRQLTSGHALHNRKSPLFPAMPIACLSHADSYDPFGLVAPYRIAPAGLDEDIKTAAAAQRRHDALEHARPPLAALVLVLAVRRALLVVGARGRVLPLLVVGPLGAVGSLRAIMSLWWGTVSHVLLLVVASVLGRVIALLRRVLLLLLLAVVRGLGGLGALACVVGRWGVCWLAHVGCGVWMSLRRWD